MNDYCKTAFISISDIEYEYGYRTSAFKHLKENDVDKAVFILNLAYYINNDFKWKAITDMQNILRYCRRYGIEPVFAIAAENTLAVTIPRTEKIFINILDYVQRKKYSGGLPFYIDDLLDSDRGDDLLIGQPLHRIEFGKWRKNIDFYIMDHLGFTENKLTSLKNCKKAIEENSLVLYNFRLYENYHNARLPITKYSLDGEFSEFDEETCKYILETSPEKLLSQLNKIDYEKIIDLYL